MPDAEDPESIARAALRANATTRTWGDDELEPLADGLSNRSWKLHRNGVPYVVRLSRADSALLGVDRGSEVALVQAAAAVGIAPPVIACDPERGLLVLRYVEGRPWTAADAQQTTNLQRLARVVSRLHVVRPPREVRRRSFREQALRLERVVGGPRGVPDIGLAERSRLAFDRLDATHPTLTLCHDDLHHLNVIDDGDRLVLIDWEYGGLGDPAFDLASVIAYHDLDPARRRALLEAYGPDGMPDRLDAAIWAFDYVQWLWYLAAARVGGGESDECLARAGRIRGRLG
jgi:thiamine kinase-like enzyme